MRLRTLLAMPCDGVGPSHTCTSLLSGMAAQEQVDIASVYVSRARARRPELEYRVSMPDALAFLPYRAYARIAERIAERRFLNELKDDEIAYLWPSASLASFEAVHARGVPIVAEGINTRMSHAREILDDAYAKAGLPPAHGITEGRIREEEDKLALTTAIFAPSPAVEASLADSPLPADAILPVSYGVAVPAGGVVERPRKSRQPDGPVRFLFVGYGCVRKGLHTLLDAWERAETGGVLQVAGRIEPGIAELCANQLNRSDVQTMGFVRNVASLYRDADVFVLPSFEEGDPLVTYEASAHGMAIVATPSGAGRIGADHGSVLTVSPGDPDSLAEALQTLARSPDRLRDWQTRSTAAVSAYDWTSVAARRTEALSARLESVGAGVSFNGAGLGP